MYFYKFTFVIGVLSASANAQYCHNISQYGRCYSNSACACFHDAGTTGVGICFDQFVDCSELAPCETSANTCNATGYRCNQHPRCNSRHVCYPVPNFNSQLCPSISETLTSTDSTITAGPITTTMTTSTTSQSLAKQSFPLRCPSSLHLSFQAQWYQNSSTVAGTGIISDDLTRLHSPLGLFVDDDNSIYIAEKWNHRIVKWIKNATSGKIVAGGYGRDIGLHQLSNPSNVIVDKATDSLIICDSSNNRVIRWSQKNATKGEVIVSNIGCFGLTMDEEGSLYVVDMNKDAVRRYRRGETNGAVVAGGNGRGSRLDQLNAPTYVFVDQDHSVYVSEEGNHRVTKWTTNAKQGVIVAGAEGEQKTNLGELTWPQGVVVDRLGTVYVADRGNSRIMRWPKGGKQGTAIVDENNFVTLWQLPSRPTGLSFDRDGNLYTADWANHRAKKFNLKSNS